MRDSESKKTIVVAVMAAIICGILIWSQYSVETIRTEEYYDVEVGNELVIELSNYETATGAYLYDNSYNYNYSYQWNISGASNQTMLRFTHTIRTQTETKFYYEAREAGNMTLSFEYRVQNEKRYIHTAHINITEG